jgi:hypothetical protein
VAARLAAGPESTAPLRLPELDSLKVFGGWERLAAIVTKIEPLKQRPDFGIFGTAIAATWLDAQTQSAARFFVEEDQNRVGRTHLGRLILAPENLPAQATVFVALPQPLAGRVAERLARLQLGLNVVLP